MTRTHDLAGGDVPFTTVGADLRARVDIANDAGARLFVSIHENALSATATGTETYHFYYSNPGARALARARAPAGASRRWGCPTGASRPRASTSSRTRACRRSWSRARSCPTRARRSCWPIPAVRQRLAEAIGIGVAKYTAAGYDAIYGQQQSLTPRYQVNAGAFRKLARRPRPVPPGAPQGVRGGDPQRVHTPNRKAPLLRRLRQVRLRENARGLRDRMRAEASPRERRADRQALAAIPAVAPR